MARRLLVMAVLMLTCRTAAAIGPFTCTLSGTTGVAFGGYNVYSSTASATTGSVTYLCGAGVLSITVDLSTGASGSYAQRYMQGSVDQLKYNLYTDAACTHIWGNNTSGTTHYSGSAIIGANVTLTIYGCMNALQDVSAGSYTDTITATINF